MAASSSSICMRMAGPGCAARPGARQSTTASAKHVCSTLRIHSHRGGFHPATGCKSRQAAAPLQALVPRTVFVAMASEELAEQDLRVLWDTIPKPLITIGKKGIEPSHCNSLRDLLSAHKVVKVKFIADNVGDAEADALSSGSDGAFLQQKGSTMMFARGDLSRASLMAVGASNTERKESRAAHRTVRREQRREDPPELSPIIGTALDRLVRKGKLQAGTIDKMALWALADLPNDEARHAVAKRMSPQAMGKVVNKSAWITSICRQVTKEQQQGSS